MKSIHLLLLAALLAAPRITAAQATGLPSTVLPDGLGVNIHFTDPKAGEMKMLADSGVRWVRMDFGWNTTEPEKGRYDFSAYDRLMAALTPHHIRPVFILDYSNRNYDNDLSPSSDEGRAAFARWAAAAARHFAGRGILWEMYNEPNIGFWRPKPNVDDYAKLALAVGKALRDAAPREVYIGPATSTIDFRFLEACFKAGCLEYWSAVSVHPYRQTPPETAASDFRRLRALIAQYAPPARKQQIPIISGEWGYSSAWSGQDVDKQGRYLPREWLTNVSNGLRLSIWYDWHDDGTDPKEPEHHFGTVYNAYHAGRDPVYDPKPAYTAAKTLTTFVRGFRFNKRLAVGGDDDYVLLFDKGREVRLACWTSSAEPHEVTIPASAGGFAWTGHLGQKVRNPYRAGADGLHLKLTDAPQYLAPIGRNNLLSIAAAWERAPLEVRARGGADVGLSLALTNPLRFRIGVEARALAPETGLTASQRTAIMPRGSARLPFSATATRSPQPIPVRLELQVNGGPVIAQRTEIVVTNPLRVTILPAADRVLPVQVYNPSGEPFQGLVRLALSDEAGQTEPTVPLAFRRGETEQLVRFPVRPGAAGVYTAGVHVTGPGGTAAVDVPAARYVRVAYATGDPATDLLCKVVADGDAKVPSEQEVDIMSPPPTGLPVPVGDALRLRYSFEPGWKFARVVFRSPDRAAIPGRPKALGMWLYGDRSGNIPRLRITDATGQTFQPDGEPTPITWSGWRYVTFKLDGSQGGHWGGAADGRIHYPIRFDTLFLLDSADRQRTSGAVCVASPTLIYAGG